MKKQKIVILSEIATDLSSS